MRLLTIAAVLSCVVLAVGRADEAAAVIQNVDLSPARPYFIPTHPRVTTTVRFPGEIGAPDGAATVFTEDATNPAAEYVITWQQGDAYFTISPLNNARMANLNVPYQGSTYVLYFYPAADELKAVASVNLVGGAETRGSGGRARSNAGDTAGPVISRRTVSPAEPHVPVTPARLLGFLDRLKLVHAMAVGPDLAQLVTAAGLEVAVSREELQSTTPPLSGSLESSGVAGELLGGVNDAGLYQLILLRAVRDRRMNCIGFICLVRNISEQVLAFDVNSFGARVGAEYLSQRISDATPILKPGENAPAYFVIQPSRNSPLLADNAWKISVDLVAPRLNPGAAIARAFNQGQR